MKKISIIALLTAAAVLYFPCCVACTNPTPEQTAVPASVSAADLMLEEGQSRMLNAVTNSSAPILYSSADESVAAVSSSGEVTGIKAGSTTISLKVEAVDGVFTAAETTVSITVTAATPVDDGKPKPGTYTFSVSPMKGKWEAGDQILVQGGYGPAAQIITLSASQISADGKTASVALDGDLFKYLTDPDPLYAVWPAEAAQKEDGLTGQVINFAETQTLFAQAYLIDNNFSFKDISSYISFSISGDYDSYIIAGAQRPGLRYSSYKNEYSSVKVTPAKPKDDGYPFREGALDGSSQTLLWFPGGINLKGGFTLYFAKGDNWTASYTYGEDVNLKAGTKLELGDITSTLEPYSGGKPHMPEVSSYSRLTVKLNELSGLCVSAGGDFLWGLGDSGEIAKISLTGEVLGKASLRTTTGSSIDSEGLSYNYDTGDYLIGGEPNVVCRIPAAGVENIFASSTFRGVESLFNIADAKGFGNSGAEGCTYYKDNLVYIGTQTGSYLYLCDLETGEVLWRKGLREMYPAITEIAGLSYDPLTDWLWVIDSESHKFFALTGDAEQLLGAYALKTKSNEEGICVDHKNNCVWVADDYGSTSYIYKYEMTGLDDFIK